jgi:hypothetical protein
MFIMAAIKIYALQRLFNSGTKKCVTIKKIIMKKIVVISCLYIFVLSGCLDSFEAQHKRSKALAKHYCGCFSKLEGKISPALMKLYNYNYGDSFQLDTDVKELSQDQMQEHQKLVANIEDSTSKLAKCLKWGDENQWGTRPLNNDKESVTHYSVMSETPDCTLGYAFITKGIQRVSNAMNRNRNN